MDYLFTKYLMDRFAMLTPHEQLIVTALHLSQWTQWRVQS